MVTQIIKFPVRLRVVSRGIITEEQPPEGRSLTDPRIAKMAFNAVFSDVLSSGLTPEERLELLMKEGVD